MRKIGNFIDKKKYKNQEDTATREREGERDPARATLQLQRFE